MDNSDSMSSVETEYSFLWFIENYDHCRRYWNEDLVSPDFTPDGMEGTSWALRLNPLRLKDGSNSVCLERSAQDAGPTNFAIEFEVLLIRADGSPIAPEKCEFTTFQKGDRHEFDFLLDLDELHGQAYAEFLPQDALGLRCRMWKSERGFDSMGIEEARKVWQCTARSRIGIEKFSFIHRVENFSSLEPFEEKTLQIPSRSKSGCVFSSFLFLGKTLLGEEAVIVETVPSLSNYWTEKSTILLIDVRGNIIDCPGSRHRFLFANWQNLLFLKKQFLLNKRAEYLPNDELSLLCEYTFTTGVEHEKVEESLYDIPTRAYKQRYCIPLSHRQSQTAEELSARLSASDHRHFTNTELMADAVSTNNNAPGARPLEPFKQKKINHSRKIKHNTLVKLSTCPSALDDFKALYNNPLLTDVALQTATKSFPAHKIVLCARSSVFRAMLSHDMREKTTNCIDVEDLDDETVQRLLLFLYSDHLEELQWDSAFKLYYAADKYAIDRLKALCYSFLVDNISTSNASELLLLADTHCDAEVTEFVEDFILEHEVEVFGSGEWEKLSETNPHLVTKIMQLKFQREPGGN